MKETLEGAEELCFPHLLNASCRKLIHSSSRTVFLYILLSSISFVTVTLNLLVIISISHFRQLQTPTNLFLLSLAVADLLVGLLVMPPTILTTLESCWLLDDHLCVGFCFIFYLITSTSVGDMVLISIDRYLAICNPMHYPTMVTQRRVQLLVCLCWIGSALYNYLLLKDNIMHPSKYRSCYGECVVVIGYILGAVDLVVTFIMPVTVIVVLYMRVFVVAVSQARAMRSHITTFQSGTATVTVKKSELKAARTLGILILVFLVCFCPYYYPSLAGQDITNSTNSISILNWLFYFNSCLNPVIYAFFYPWFRKAIKLIASLQILQPHSSKTKIL